MNLRSFLVTVAAVALLHGAPARAASLSVIFDSPTPGAAAGDSVIFSGTATNLAGAVADLNGCSVSLAGPFTTDNCAIFFDLTFGAPATLSATGTPGASAHFDMFVVTVASPFAPPFGLQPPGTFTITGALEGGGGADTNLGEANFQLDVVVPEPGTAALFWVTFPAAFALRRRTARRPTTPRP